MGSKKEIISHQFITCGEITKLIVVNKKNKEFEILFDTEDYDKIKHFYWNPCYHKSISGYYVCASEYIAYIDKKQIRKTHYLHRYILGIIDRKVHVDHINHNQLDNRKSNLRITDNEHNLKHRKWCNNTSTTGHRNVSWSNAVQRYLVQFQVDGKNKCFGRFKILEDAIIKAEEIRKVLYKDFSGEDRERFK